MFTGLVEGPGICRSASATSDGATIDVDLGPFAAGVSVGDSVSIAGCCLTVTRIVASTASFTMIPETLSRTRLARLRAGDRINVERPLALGDRLDGHLVQGHVDGVGTVSGVRIRGVERDVAVALPAELARFVVEKGSIAVDGVSLTVARATSDGFEVALIPLTCEKTTLGALRAGDHVNIEVDVFAKWMERMLAPRANGFTSRS